MPTFASPAKINLHLQVVGRRADGYHELRTIFQTVDLHDDLVVELEGRGAAVSLQVTGADLSPGPDNLAYRAASGFLARWAPHAGVRIHLHKRIPMGGGLGGGSSNAATVLLALQQLLEGPAPASELWQLARSLGADVPYFLVGGTALGVGRGDEILPLPELAERELWLVLPALHVSTPEVFKSLGELTASHLEPTIMALVQRGELGWEAMTHVVNDLERPVFSRWPELGVLHQQLQRAGAVVARLSGSGTALWALMPGSTGEEWQSRLPAGIRLERVRTQPRSRLAALHPNR